MSVFNRTKNNTWKEKAKKRRVEKKKLKKRIKELEKSRDNWKSKYKHSKKELETVKNTSTNNNVQNSKTPRNYSYSSIIIYFLTKIKLHTSTSFRAIVLNFEIFMELNIIPSKVPTHTTIINWIHKIGYYELTKQKEKADDWIIILDESIQLGQEKILVIYGIREKNIDFTRPLKFCDLVPLRIIVKRKWTGEIIKKELQKLMLELKTIKCAVADFGSDIRKGLRLSKIPHVHDLTHKIALVLQKIYKDDKKYDEVTKKMSEMRTLYSQTKNAYIIPPKQRKKSRYQNIKIISDYCMKSLNYIQSDKNVDREIYDKLKWLIKYKAFIKDLSLINEMICKLEKELKYNGLSNTTLKKSITILSTLRTKRGKIIKTEITSFLHETQNLLKYTNKMLITSDIIESAFGKYKNYVSLNPMAGVTNLILSLAAFTFSFDCNKIGDIFENVKTEDIKKWTKKNIGTTILKNRKLMFSRS